MTTTPITKIHDENEGTPTNPLISCLTPADHACNNQNKETSSLITMLRVTRADQHDYEKLQAYHYQKRLAFSATEIWKLVGNNQRYNQFPDPVSILVLSSPLPEITARIKATAGYFHQIADLSERLTMLNKYVIYLSRLITDPRYLRHGLALHLVKEVLNQTEWPIVETLTPIDFTNTLYQKAGFELHFTPAPKKFGRLMRAFSRIGLQIRETTHPELVHQRLAYCSAEKRDFIEAEIQLFMSGFRNSHLITSIRDKVTFILSKVPPPEAYLIWYNPRSELADEVKAYSANSPSSSIRCGKSPGGIP